MHRFNNIATLHNCDVARYSYDNIPMSGNIIILFGKNIAKYCNTFRIPQYFSSITFVLMHNKMHYNFL